MIADLVLRGGTICDGSGALARTGDVAIVGDRILGTGRYDGPSRREIDAVLAMFVGHATFPINVRRARDAARARPS